MSKVRILNCILVVLLVLSCGGSEKQYLPFDRFSFPVDLVLDSYNKNIYVVSSNFDLGYKNGNIKGISIDALKPLLKAPCKDECRDYNSSVIVGEGVGIGSYAGISVFYNDKIFVPLRRDNKIAIIETDARGNLFCGKDRSVIGDCDEQHLIDLEYKEPFSLVKRDGDSCIYTSFLKNRLVLCVNADKPFNAPSVYSDFSNGYEIGGVKDIDISSDGIMVSAYAYMMGGRNLIPVSYDFKGVKNTVFLDFTDQITTAYQVSVKFSRITNRFFITLRNPDLLLSVDYAIYKDGTFIVVDYRLIPLYRYPSRIYVAGLEGSKRELLFVAMEDDDRIQVYDTGSLSLVSEIREGLDGPYAMRLTYIDAIPYLFVGNFENSTVSVYKYDDKDQRFDFLFSIGRPRTKESGEY